MGRSPTNINDQSGLKKGPWTPEEDQKLVNYIHKNGHGSWRALPKLAGLNRCGKSCRLRWTNYLRPDIKRGKFSPEEEQTILNFHSILGNKWSAIATHLPGRTDNEIKNFWNTHLKKKLIQMGFDPMTHRPRTDFFATLPQYLIALASLRSLVDTHPHPWVDNPSPRLHADATQVAKLQYLNYLIQTMSNTPTTTTPSISAITTDSAHLDTVNSQLGSLALQPILSPMGLPDLERCELSALSSSFGPQPPLSFAALDGSPVPGASAFGDASLPPLADVSVCSQGDECSASGTPAMWPDMLLDEQFMAELAESFQT